MSRTYGRFTRESGRRAANARWKNHVPDREESSDDRHYRMLEDRRGFVVREGITYKADGETRFKIRYSLDGRTDQYDVIANGKTWMRGGARKIKKATGIKL